ncbi:permease [Demequina sp. TTPB684]|uniref:permease n=1 Tax=unclassified Demequina TaxID=2620311 RepID=UPI001CF54E8C|nr:MULTISPECIES: permease [unclassified Demequina]MCB2412324.1 permease [Demequina sp. TTPB684]UPU89481.1 permease [Demequina sp. TMPB413]
MTLVGHLPETKRGIGAVSVGAALVWLGAYQLNERMWDWLLFDGLGLDPDARPASALHFFLYDTVKIALLLTGIIFAVGVLRTFITIERTRALLGGRREGVGNVMAAGLGVATPFCSCSAVPAFIGFVGAGVPIGVTLSFLIASPLVNEIAVGLLWTAFGWQIALLYVAAGLLIAITAGWVLGRMGVERWVEPFVLKQNLLVSATSAAGSPGPGTPGAGAAGVDTRPSPRLRVRIGIQEVRDILGKVWPYLLVGVGIGAVIHGWVPSDFFAEHAGPENPVGVLVAVVLGVPLYSNAAGALPLVEALADKGVPMGTLLAFMMSVVALSLPEMVLLKRVLKLPLLGAFVGVVAVGIVAVGYLFNAILT